MEAISKTSKIDKIIKLTLLTIVGSILITISAKIKIPFYPVPMTMQTFVILLIGITYGYKIGLATVTLYLLEGIFGLPVFANSPEKGIFIFADIVIRIEPTIVNSVSLIILSIFEVLLIASIFIQYYFFCANLAFCKINKYVL